MLLICQELINVDHKIEGVTKERTGREAFRSSDFFRSFPLL